MHCFFFHFFLFPPLSFRAGALKKVAAAAAAAGVAWGLPVGSKERAAEVFEQGATFINLGEILVPVMKELASSSGTLDEVFAAAGSGAKDTGTAAKDEEAAHVP